MDRKRSIVARVWMAAAVLALTGTSLPATPITTPPGLNPGDHYRLAFVTSSATTAFSGTIGDYNTFVTGVANGQSALVALGTTWTAIASTSAVDARDNTGTNPSSTGVPIYLLDGSKIANDNADLWDGTLLHALNVTESGGTLSGILPWTGTNSSGLKGTGTAGPLGGDPIAAGLTSATNSQWIVAGGYDPFGPNPNPMYAISGVLTVPNPAVPPTITKSFGKAVVGLDSPGTTMTVTISNPGANSIPLTGVGFTDTFPAGLVVATPNGLTSTCGGTATATAGLGSLTLSGGTLAVGGTCTVSVGVNATSLGTKVNTTGAVTSTEGGSGTTATASLVVVPTVPALGARELLLLAVLLAVLGAIALGS